MITVFLLSNIAFLAISICVYVNICNDLEWISVKELLSVIKESFSEADSGTEAAMIVFAIFLLPSILISCLVIHIIYSSFSK